MKTISKWLCLIVALSFLSNCKSKDDDPCSNTLPPPDWFQITVQNTAGNPLIGDTFTQDSFRLYQGNEVEYLKPVPFGATDALQVFYESIEPNQVYFIDWSASDTDTLQIRWHSEPAACGDNYFLDWLLFNGEEVDNLSDDPVVLVKN